jgi:5-methylcytosine-specific restriction endonuclease McrA
MLPLVEAMSTTPGDDQLVPGRVVVNDSEQADAGQATDELVPGRVAARGPADPAVDLHQLVPGRVGGRTARSTVTPIAPQRYGLHLSVSQNAHDDLREAQELLGHEIPPVDAADVVELALALLVADLKKRKFAATREPKTRVRRTTSRRHVPAHVRRAVWKRDGGQCTFVSESGRRCAARTMLEYDHVDPVARGGCATVAGIRLRCRGHNQYEAERVFGAGFMEEKRENARRAKEARTDARAAAEAQAQAAALAKERANEVIPYLRRLGFNADESRRAAAFCESIPDASLEERVRRALSYFRPLSRTVSATPTMTRPMREVGAQPCPA